MNRGHKLTTPHLPAPDLGYRPKDMPSPKSSESLSVSVSLRCHHGKDAERSHHQHGINRESRVINLLSTGQPPGGYRKCQLLHLNFLNQRWQIATSGQCAGKDSEAVGTREYPWGYQSFYPQFFNIVQLGPHTLTPIPTG